MSETEEYHDLEGSISFDIGSNVEQLAINTIPTPRKNRKETITIILNEPTGDDFPKLGVPKIIDVEIENNIPPARYAFTNKTIKILQSQIQDGVQIPIQRSGYMRENSVVSFMDNTVIGKEEFIEYQIDQQLSHVMIPISDKPQKDSKLTIECELASPLGDTYAELDDEHKRLTIEVELDVPGSIIYFEQTNYQISRQQSDIININVIRSRRCTEQEILTFHNGFSKNPSEEKVKFDIGQTVYTIALQIEQIPRDTEVDNFKICLKDILGPYCPDIDSERAICDLNILNDIPKPLVSFQTISSGVMQSQECIQVFVVRSGFIKNPIRVKWGIVKDEADDMLGHYSALKGEIIFTKNDTDLFKVINFPPYQFPLPSPDTSLSVYFVDVTTDPIVKEYMPTIHPFKAHSLTIHNNIPRPLIQFTCKKISCMQSEKVVSVPIERRYDHDVNFDRIMSFEHEIQWKVLYNDEKDEPASNMNPAGILKFKSGQEELFLKIEFPSLPQPVEFTNFSVELLNVGGDYFPVLGAMDKCLIEVQNDVSHPEFEFLEKNILCRQSEGKVVAQVRKSHYLDDKHVVQWEVPGRDIEGEIYFDQGYSRATISISLPNAPQNQLEDVFTIELTSVDGPKYPDIGHNKVLRVTVKNDLMKPQINFAERESGFTRDDPCIIKQSDGRLNLKVERSGFDKDEVIVCWSSEVIDGNPSFGDFVGLETFQPLHNKNTIAVTLPDIPFEDCESTLFCVMLEDPEGENSPALGSRWKMFIRVIHDIEQPCVEFADSYFSCYQTDDGCDVKVIRKGAYLDQVVNVSWKCNYKNLVDDLYSQELSGIYNQKSNISFERGEKEVYLKVPTVRVPRPNDSDIVVLKLTGIKRSKTTCNLGLSTCNIEIKNDFPKPIVGFQGLVTRVPRSIIYTEVNIIRTEPLDCETTVMWEIAEIEPIQGDSTLLSEDDGILKFEEGETSLPIKLEMLQSPFNAPLKKIKVTITEVHGENYPKTHLTESVHELHITNDIQTPSFGFQDECEQTVHKKSDGDIVIPVYRKNSGMGAATINWQSVVDGDTFNGSLEFAENDHCQFIKLPPGERERIQVKITNISGDFDPEFQQRDIIVAVEKDYMGPTLSWDKDEFEIRQSAEILMVPLVRTGDTSVGVRAVWTVFAETGKNSPYRGLYGHIEIEPEQLSAHVQINLSRTAQDNKMDKFELRLSDLEPEDAHCRLGIHPQLKMTVLNDLDRSVVNFEDDQYNVVNDGSCTELKLSLLRTADRAHDCEVSWKVEEPYRDFPNWGLSPYFGIRGVEYFEKSEFRKVIMVQIPNTPRPESVEKFNIRIKQLKAFTTDYWGEIENDRTREPLLGEHCTAYRTFEFHRTCDKGIKRGASKSKRKC